MSRQPETEVLNPFVLPARSDGVGTTALVEQDRAAAEVQGMIVAAKRFPRDEHAAMNRILRACTRKTLAEQAQYAYRRGSELVEGPSIRLAEAISQNWGNIYCGIVELEQRAGESVVQAFAWDLETNTRQVKTFTVKHVRERRSGNVALTGARDIYELTANMGARRLRACILGVIPGDVVDAAVNQCEVTLRNSVGAPHEQIHKLVEAFDEHGVTKAQIARYLGHDLDATTAAEVIRLRKVYVSIRDGFSRVDEHFHLDADARSTQSGLTEKLRDVSERRKNRKTESTAETRPSPEILANEIAAMAKAAKSDEELDEAESLLASLDGEHRGPPTQAIKEARARLSSPTAEEYRQGKGG